MLANRRRREKEPVVIVVNGLIGAGKSTLINLLGLKLTERGYRVAVVQEPVDEWKQMGALQAYGADIRGMAYKFQTLVFATRVLACNRAYERHPDVDIFILERSVQSDKLFMQMLREDGYVTDLEWAMYQTWADTWEGMMPFSPTAFFYLKPSLDECMRRLKSRARDGEGGITPEYQSKLERLHDEAYCNSSLSVSGEIVPSYVIPTDLNFKDHPQHQAEVTAIFEKFLSRFEHLRP